jgi:hypothetical protein
MRLMNLSIVVELWTIPERILFVVESPILFVLALME